MIKQILGALSLTAVIWTGTSTVTHAMPMAPSQPLGVQTDVVKVGGHRHHRKRKARASIHFHISGGFGYYGGYRGYRHKRHGYRYYKGYWFPAAAFVIHGSRHGHKYRHHHRGSLHVAWCKGRYKTYRASDNTYAYKVGKRTYCRSPYRH